MVKPIQPTKFYGIHIVYSNKGGHVVDTLYNVSGFIGSSQAYHESEHYVRDVFRSLKKSQYTVCELVEISIKRLGE